MLRDALVANHSFPFTKLKQKLHKAFVKLMNGMHWLEGLYFSGQGKSLKFRNQKQNKVFGQYSRNWSSQQTLSKTDKIERSKIKKKMHYWRMEIRTYTVVTGSHGVNVPVMAVLSGCQFLLPSQWNTFHMLIKL